MKSLVLVYASLEPAVDISGRRTLLIQEVDDITNNGSRPPRNLLLTVLEAGFC
jgi:hypothetical protein